MSTYTINQKLALKLLKEFSSDDPTRSALTYPYFDGQRVVATDGHRMFMINKDAVGGLFNGPIPATPTYVTVEKDGLRAIAVEGQFPDYQRVIPKVVGENSGLFEVPAWIAKLGSARKFNVPMDLYKDENSVWQYRISSAGTKHLGDNVVTVNPSLLSELAGFECRLSTGSEFDPILLVPSGAESDGSGKEINTLDLNWCAVVMPIRR